MWLLLIIASVAVIRAEEPPIQIVAFTSGASMQPLGEARIVASKFLLSNYAVEGKVFVIDYRLYNVGDKPALKVILDDRHNFPTQYFEIVRGLLQVRWDRIGAGANVTHSVALKPRQFGSVNYTAAVITYLPSEDVTEPRTGYSSSPGEGYIYALKDYERKFSPHYMDWGIFALMALPCLLPPVFLWYRSSKKYELADSKKNK